MEQKNMAGWRMAVVSNARVEVQTLERVEYTL